MSNDAVREAFRTGTAVWPTGDRVIVIRGADRASWLAGMVTADVAKIEHGAGRYTAIVSVKGRILADAWVHAREAEIWLAVPDSTAEALLVHFDQHVIMEDVETGSTDWQVWACAGEASGLFETQGAPPSGPGSRVGTNGRDVFVTEPDDAAWLERALAAGTLVRVSEADVERERIAHAVPRFGVDFTSENFVQEAAITDRAVSFNKGCYLGQEVVCRLQMRGHVRKQLAAFTLDAPPPANGTATSDGGVVTSAAWDDEANVTHVLAMVAYDTAHERRAVQIAGHTAQPRA